MDGTERDDLLVCNCAGCGVELAGTTAANADVVRRLRAELPGFAVPEYVRGRIAGRPFCSACLVPAVRGRGA